MFGQNEDFENSMAAPITSSNQVQGWRFSNHTNWSCGNISDSVQQTLASEIIFSPNSNGYVDPIIGSVYPIHSVFGGTVQNNGLNYNPNIGNMYGNSFVRLGKSNAQQNIEQMSKKIKVDSLNWLFKYAYMFVTVPGEPGVHNCCTHPMLKVIVTDITTNTVINYYNHFTYLYNPSVLFPCFQLQNSPDAFYLSNSTITVSPSSNPFNPFYTKWNTKTLTLLPYEGDSLRIDFITSKCGDGSHFGYGYIDAQLFSGNIYVNTILNTTGNFASCSNVTLSTIPNYIYSWNGPNINNVPTQSLVVNTSGVYSLTISNSQSVICTQTINITINTPASVSIISSNDSICTNQSLTLSINNSNLGPYFWSNGGNASSIIVSPTVTTFYYVNAVDSNACLTFASKTIKVIQCTQVTELELLKQNLKLFPQPASDELNLIFETEVFSDFNAIKIYNSIGQVVIEEPIEFIDGQAQIKTTDLANGVYTLQLSFLDTALVPRATRNDNYRISKRFLIAK